MKCRDVILHLMRWLPEYTGLFSEYIQPLTVNVTGTLVTMTFSTDHGLANNSIVTIKDALVENQISSIVDSGSGIVFTTTLDHDITFGQTENVYLSSATDPGINGFYDIVRSDNRRTFVLDSFPDVGLSDVILSEPLTYRNINGTYNITVTATNQFIITLSESFPVDPVINVPSVNVLSSIRISGGSSLPRLIKSYDEQNVNELWGFVVLGNSTVSKDRNVEDDPVLQQGNLNDWGILLMQDFTFFVFIPTKNSSGFVNTTGRSSRDIAEDIRAPLYKALLGTEFDTGLYNSPSSSTVPVGDGLQQDLDAYIIHAFQFQQVAYVSTEDLGDKEQNVSLRDIDIEYTNYFGDNDNVIMTAAINTDVDPV